MPQSLLNWDAHTTNALIAEQLNYSPTEQRQLYNDYLPSLNRKQCVVYDSIIHCFDHHTSQLFFTNGPGGTGKTYIYKTICAKLRSEDAIVLAVASSGIAALLIPGGRTAHSTFKIPIDGITSESLCSISKNSTRGELLRRVAVIIWDEASMQHQYAIEALDRTLRNIRGVDLPFGGVIILFGGDWEQCLPVIEHGHEEEIIDSTIQHSYLWPHIQVLHLHENMCLAHGDTDADFAQWLLDIGHGCNSSSNGNVEIPEHMTVHSADNLINIIYPDIDCTPPPPQSYFTNRMILAPRNDDVTNINNTILQRMSGDQKTYFSADKVE